MSCDDMNIDDEFLQDFIIEAKEHLEAIEVNVLALENEEDSEKIIHSLFRAFHTIKGLAGFVEQDLIGDIAHKTETILDLCRKETLVLSREIADLILNSADLIGEICDDITLIESDDFKANIKKYLEYLESIEKKNESANKNKSTNIGEIPLEKKGSHEEDSEYLLEKEEEQPDLKSGEIAVKEKKAKAKDILEGICKEKSIKTSEKESGPGLIRISTRKLDNLVDMMGELIITQSQVEQEAEKKFDNNDDFITKLSNMSRIMKEMQYISMSLRMISLKSTFNKISRIARDTIRELQKDVEFITNGEETEIDRNVADKLLEPLVHLIKNSISHGIESPDIRQDRGKNKKGQVIVSAYSNKGSVYIEISDDGNGIDLEKVYNKALDKGLIDENKKYSDKEIEEFIFLPGFSTTQKVDTVSGRGVGMDVVRTEVSKFGGKIEIHNREGEGCKFILKIPINLAVMNGTIISIADNKYILPTLNIKQIIQVEAKNWIELKGKKTMIKLRDSLVPIINISKIIGGEGTNDSELVIVLELEEELKAIEVDDIIGRREIVVKPLSEEFSNLDYISGASILGDGKVSLILDIEYLFKN